MKLIPTILLLAASCLPAVHAQVMTDQRVTGGSAITADSKGQLQLTTGVIEKHHHCSDFVGFKVRLTFKNVGKRPTILDKRSLVAGLTVSRDLEAAAAKRYEVERLYDSFGLGDYFDVDPSDMSNFIILKPGEDYALDKGVGSFWVADGVPPPKGYLNAGTHYLQLKVITWTYFTAPAPFSRKWTDQGFLWSEGLTSLPMPFTVEVDHQSPECR